MEQGISKAPTRCSRLAMRVFGLILTALPLTAWSALDAAPATPAINEQQAIALATNRIETGKQFITVTNRRHHARFDQHGVHFTPRRGPDWRWRLTHINTDKNTAVPPVRGAVNAVDYDRGGLIERYLIKAATIEQRFVLEHPWPKGQDLVIRGAIESPGKMEPREQGWVWRDASGVVTLGQVTVFDATGKVLPAQMQVTETHSTIRVAAADLEAATYPVTVDPEIGTNDFRISEMGTDGLVDFRALSPDVTYNAIANEYLVVWHGDDNTPPLVDNEFEIFGQRINAATGAEIGPDFRISDMGPNSNISYGAFSPAVAYNATSDEYLVVWRGDDVDDEFEIYGQRITAATGAAIGTNDFRISDMGVDGNVLIGASGPAVTYNATGDEYLVVWSGDDVDEEFEIYGQRITAATGAAIGTNDFRISDMGVDGNVLIGASLPDVAYNATGDEYLVVWSGDDVDEEFEIYGQRITAATGAAIGTNDFRISDMGPDGNVLTGASFPDVAYNATGDEYLVVWRGDDVDEEFEIYGQLITAATGAAIGTNDFRISDMGVDGNISYSAFAPGVTWSLTANEYLVVWHGDDSIAPLVDNEYEIFGQRLTATGTETGDNDFRLSDMGPVSNADYDAFTPALAWNATDNEFLVVWRGDDNTAPLMEDEFEIFGQLFEAVTMGGGIPVSSGRDHEGHCSLGRPGAAVDPTLWLLVVVSLIYLGRRQTRRSRSS